MVDVVNTRTRDVDWLLDRADDDWDDVALVFEERDEWSPDDLFTMLIDWGVPTGRLHRLAEAAARGVMTPPQLARYQALLQVVEARRPLLDQLRAKASAG